jgi:nicotinate dehydrogenase subunit B
MNPDGLRNQVKSNHASAEPHTSRGSYLRRSRIPSVVFLSYPILWFPSAPPIEVALLNYPDLPIYGAGEASETPVSAALANAIFDATAIRLRNISFSPARLLAAFS